LRSLGNQGKVVKLDNITSFNGKISARNNGLVARGNLVIASVDLSAFFIIYSITVASFDLNGLVIIINDVDRELIFYVEVDDEDLLISIRVVEDNVQGSVILSSNVISIIFLHDIGFSSGERSKVGTKGVWIVDSSLSSYEEKEE